MHLLLLTLVGERLDEMTAPSCLCLGQAGSGQKAERGARLGVIKRKGEARSGEKAGREAKLGVVRRQGEGSS